MSNENNNNNNHENKTVTLDDLSNELKRQYEESKGNNKESLKDFSNEVLGKDKEAEEDKIFNITEDKKETLSEVNSHGYSKSRELVLQLIEEDNLDTVKNYKLLGQENHEERFLNIEEVYMRLLDIMDVQNAYQYDFTDEELENEIIYRIDNAPSILDTMRDNLGLGVDTSLNGDSEVERYLMENMIESQGVDKEGQLKNYLKKLGYKPKHQLNSDFERDLYIDIGADLQSLDLIGDGVFLGEVLFETDKVYAELFTYYEEKEVNNLEGINIFNNEVRPTDMDREYSDCVGNNIKEYKLDITGIYLAELVERNLTDFRYLDLETNKYEEETELDTELETEIETGITENGTISLDNLIQNIKNDSNE